MPMGRFTELQPTKGNQKVNTRCSDIGRKLGAVCLLGLMAGPVAAHAQGWYGGAGIGQSKAKDVEPLLDSQSLADCALLGWTCSASDDDKDTGFKLFAGYRINENFSLEGMFVDFGEMSAEATIFDGVDSLSESISAEATGLAVVAVGNFPLSDSASLLAKFGLFRWEVDGEHRVTSTVPGFAFSESASDSGTDPMFGLGIEFMMGKAWGIRAEWEKFTDVGDAATTGQSDVDFLSLSALFSF